MTEIRGFIIGAFVICFMAIGLLGFFSSFATSYNQTANTTDFQSIALAQKIQTNTTNLIGNSTVNPNDLNGLSGSFFTTINGITFLFSMMANGPALMISLISDFTNALALAGFAIPTWFISMLIGVISLVVAFAVAYQFIRGRV